MSTQLRESSAAAMPRSMMLPPQLQGLLAVLGRIMLCTIFFLAAVGDKIPNFDQVATERMAPEGVPFPHFMLVGAIAFLLVGSVSVVVGYKARVGALLLLVFLALAAFFFHDFWNVPEAQVEAQMIHFMKNLSMMGAMIFIMAVGSGPWSIDSALSKRN
jgi:putative oxidoreductase